VLHNVHALGWVAAGSVTTAVMACSLVQAATPAVDRTSLTVTLVPTAITAATIAAEATAEVVVVISCSIPTAVDAAEDARFLALARQNYSNDQILRRLPELALPDSLLVAGCLFQTIWNIQSGKEPAADILDYDIFYFDADLSWEAENVAIGKVNEAFGDLGVPVQVRNQARVHLWYESKFGIPCKPLISSEDGIDHFLNRSSCFGIRPFHDGVDVYTSFGFEDLYAMIVRPNRRRDLPLAYAEKAARWKSAWPTLTVLPWESIDRARDVV
jgi:uncharacterized protein